MKDPEPDCDGGGGTTDFVGSGILPPARRCVSCDTSDDGGGAITEGAGMLSFGLRVLARSGAETGGGITAALVIWTGELETSRLTPPGAGGITLLESAGVERVRSRDAFGAGATTEVASAGEVNMWSREMLGAGAITVGAKAGAYRVWSFETLGAGGIALALRVGAIVDRSRDADGAGAMTESS
jgi:hypothetical protein